MGNTIYLENSKGEQFKVVLFTDEQDVIDNILDQVSTYKGELNYIGEAFYKVDEETMTVGLEYNRKLIGELHCKKIEL